MMDLKTLWGILTPNEAQAELIPITLGATAILKKALVDPSAAGDAVRLAQAQPEKAYVSDQPTFAQKWLGNSMGSLTTTPLGTRNINLNAPLLDYMSKRTGQDEQIRTLGHEAGHFLGEVTGKAGNIEPTSTPLLDYLVRALVSPMGKDLRQPVDTNESIADTISGLQTGSSGVQNLVSQILSAAKARQK